MVDPRMPVTTLVDLDALNDDEILHGYRDGRKNDPEPGGNRSRAYWHGWRNGRVDGRHVADPDPAQQQLVRLWLDRERERRNAG